MVWMTKANFCGYFMNGMLIFHFFHKHSKTFIPTKCSKRPAFQNESRKGD